MDLRLAFKRTRLLLMWSAQVRRWSRIKPKYLELVTFGMTRPFKVIGGTTPCFKVKVK